jgi:hypothetical protein
LNSRVADRRDQGAGRRAADTRQLHQGSAALALASHLHDVLVDSLKRKNVVGEIDRDVQNGQDFPFRMS